MCGIVAIFAYRDHAPPVEQEELFNIRESMVKRGPDGAELWTSDDRKVGLAHRRLAIIDLTDAGAQPMATSDGMVRITFNGEIYNYRELRQHLMAKGYEFRSNSDTEVLLHLYEELGHEMVYKLRGMYAFAIWDERKHGLFLVRDPFGIKPLYYADDGATIRVASQVKALLKGGHIDSNSEPAGHVGFLLWGHVPEPYTLYRGIKVLPAGTTLCVDGDGRKQTRQFFNITYELAEACEAWNTFPRDEVHERLRAALLDSMSHHLIADVPVGVFLSAGIDSGTLTGLAREVSNGDLHTITLGFKEFQGTTNDEVPLAEQVAKRYGTYHYTAWITRQDFQKERNAILEAMDQPSIDGVNIYFVSKGAAKAGLKVAISGLGGDELFGGYPSFQQIPPLVNAVSPLQTVPFIGKRFRFFSASILKYFTSPKYAGLLEYGGNYGGAYLLRRGMFMPWELPEQLDPEIVKKGWEDLRTLSHLEETTDGINSPRLKVTALETTWYMRNQLLRDADWASMAHSLEIRVPFVDIELYRTVACLVNSKNAPGKHDMAGTPRSSLPNAVVEREKTGFAVPMREWIMDSSDWASRERGIRGWARFVLAHEKAEKGCQ